MIKCPSCGAEHRPGTLFCIECGAYLIGDGTQRTSPLPTDELPIPEGAAEPVPVESQSPQHLRPLRLYILNTEREIQLPMASEILVGRLDAAHGIFPDLDLTADGGLEGGVSRRHAKLVQRGGEILIEDLGSANGTMVNNRRLTPYLPYALKSGDEVTVGKIKFRLVLEE